MSETPAPQNRPVHEAQVIINYQDAAPKPPPLLEVGILAWMRKNLFSSLMDVVLTFTGLFVAVGVIVSFFNWAVYEANWVAITFNFRQFMVGSFYTPQDMANEGRMLFLLAYVALLSGAMVAAYMRRISFFWMGMLVVSTVPVFVIPLVANTAFALPFTYSVATSQTIVSGTASTDGLPQVAFIGREGDEIVLRYAAMTDDQSLKEISGFADVGSNLLRNAATNRRADIERAAELKRLFAEDEAALAQRNGMGTLTANQRDRLQRELARVDYVIPEEAQARIAEIDVMLTATLDEDTVAELRANREALTQPPMVFSTYAINQVDTELKILNASLEPLIERTLSPGDELRFTLPASGWYVLDKRIAEDQTGTVILEMTNIHPIFQRSDRFERMTDDLLVRASIPRLDDEPLPFLNILDNQYRGVRSLETYLRVYLTPFLAMLTPGLAQLLAFGLLGFFAAKWVDRAFSPRTKPRMYSVRMATWLLIASPIVMFLMINGIGISPLDFSDTRRWGGLLLAAYITVFGMVLAFPLGVGLALGRRSELPAIKYLSTLIIEFVRGTPFIVVLFAGQLLIPLINPAFAEIPNAYRALGATIIFIAAYLAENVRGGLQAIPPGQYEAAKAIGLSNWQTTVFITLPQALRAVIPALVGQIISLFKDTSLLAIVGLIDLAGVVNQMVVQREFVGTRREGLFFITVVYFVLSYVMSYISRRIEESGSGSARRI